MELTTIAYPKVNLHLAVGSKRPDGFHEIASIFQLVEDSFYNDKISLIVEESDSLVVKVKGLEGVADEKDNTIVKACNLFASLTGLQAKITVSICKNIPSQAGLGGGSSDAAAVLRLLNSAFPIDLNLLIKESDKIGSDVPFFVCGCKAAVVTGRGENVYPIEAKDLNIKLFPNNFEKISTAEAYKMLDSRSYIAPLMTVKELEEMYKQPIDKWKFYNDFELVNKPANDSRYRLTGSGSCRFTID